MPETIIKSDTHQILLLLRRLFHSRTHLESLMPAHLLEARTRLANTYTNSKKDRSADFELLYRVGALLAHRTEPVSMGELSRDLAVPLSTATRIVDWLVRGDYAQRLPDPDDRRVVRVALTPTGMEMYRIAQGVLQEQAQKWLSEFTPQECQTLIALLGRLVAAIEKE